MNISYLLSILDLYLLKENNRTLIIQVDNQTNQVKVNFAYSSDLINKTFVKIDKNIFLNYLIDILEKIQGNLENPIENLEKNNNQIVYTVNFNNQRKISFIDFSYDELKLIRKNFNNLEKEFDFNIDSEISNKNTYDKELSKYKIKFNYSLGFTNYLTLFISSIFFLDIFMIALLIFKIT